MLSIVPTELPQSGLETQIRCRLQELLPGQPDWLQGLRLKALSRFEVLGFPTRRQEAWKYLNLRPLLSQVFSSSSLFTRTQSAEVLPEQLRPYLRPNCLEQDSAENIRLVFVNGLYNESLSTVLSHSNPLPEGVWIGSLQSAVQQVPQLVQTSLEMSVGGEPDAFASLNNALFEDGLFIHVPAEAEIAPLVQVLFVTTTQNQAHCGYVRNIIQIAPQAKLQLSIEHIGLGDVASLRFNQSFQTFEVAESAEVECTILFHEAAQDWHFSVSRCDLAEKARLSLNTVSLSGKVIRHSISTLLKGERSQVHLNGLDVLFGDAEVYHHTVTEHWVPSCVSTQYYKGILDDSAKSEFNGMVFVAQGANETDSQQLNKSLLLSENARVWTRPQLQINADDVKCAHGATVGQLEEEQLFYMASRGLDRELAQALLTYGFAEEIIQRISNPEVRHYLDTRVLNNLHRADTGLKRQLGAS